MSATAGPCTSPAGRRDCKGPQPCGGHQAYRREQIKRNMRPRAKKECQRHAVFPGGHPSKYYPHPTSLNYGERTRTGVSDVVWPLAEVRGERVPYEPRELASGSGRAWPGVLSSPRAICGSAMSRSYPCPPTTTQTAAHYHNQKKRRSARIRGCTAPPSVLPRTKEVKAIRVSGSAPAP
jgi:hypothetical protein